MQSLDEILTDITSKVERLIRKLAEQGIDNELLQKENRQLKQNILAKGKVDLFSNSIEKKASSENQNEISKRKQELDNCIKEVKACIKLADEE